MKFSVTASGLSGVGRGFEDGVAGILTRTARQMTASIKADLRAETVSGGLGPRVANAWRGETYPKGRDSMGPASYVKTNAPRIIDAFSRVQVILPTDGRRYLAIPTKNVPLKGRGRKMTPVEVEASFNQDLILRPSRTRRSAFLGFVNVIQAKNLKGWRRATAGRLAQGRAVKLVLMFVFVRSVKTRQRLDLAAVAARASAAYPGMLDANWR